MKPLFEVECPHGRAGVDAVVVEHTINCYVLPRSHHHFLRDVAHRWEENKENKTPDSFSFTQSFFYERQKTFSELLKTVYLSLGLKCEGEPPQLNKTSVWSRLVCQQKQKKCDSSQQKTNSKLIEKAVSWLIAAQTFESFFWVWHFRQFFAGTCVPEWPIFCCIWNASLCYLPFYLFYSAIFWWLPFIMKSFGSLFRWEDR